MSDQASSCSDNDDKQYPRRTEKKAGYESEFVEPQQKHLQSALDCKVKAPYDVDCDDKKQAEQTGYECEFVESPLKNHRRECPICLQILREPHLIDCCGYNFCAACIERVGKDGKPCPLCNEPVFTTMANKGLKRDLNEFRVYCPHRLCGCEWEGELGKLDEHLNSDPQPERQLEGCLIAVIECLHCKEGICRDKIAGHQLERCPQRPYTCEYCAEYKSNFEDVVHSHWPECKYFLLPCPNECPPSGSGIQRQYLDQHVKEECPLTVVQCELHHAGCDVTLPRKDMAEHMKEDPISHISLLTAENQRLSKQLKEKEEQMILLTRQNTEEHTRTKQELTQTKQELTRIEQELLVKVTFQSQQLTRVEDELKAHQQAIVKLQIQQQRDLRELRTDVEMRRDIVPVTIKMAGFDELKKKGTKWFSRPFFTCVGGYKMCLSVHANGYGAGKGNHVSVFTNLVCGEFDSHLQWPFRGTVTIQIVNQLEDKQHCTNTYLYNDTAPANAAQVTGGDRISIALGLLEFLIQSELGLNVANNCQYLKDDCLVFRIVSVLLN